ncbi:unnamed protein product, partial [Polarella glacialis]
WQSNASAAKAGKCTQGRRNDQREECPEVQLTGGAATGVLPESRAVRAVAALAQEPPEGALDEPPETPQEGALDEPPQDMDVSVQLTGGAATGVLPESRAVRAVAALAQDARATKRRKGTTDWPLEDDLTSEEDEVQSGSTQPSSTLSTASKLSL